MIIERLHRYRRNLCTPARLPTSREISEGGTGAVYDMRRQFILDRFKILRVSKHQTK